MGIYSENQCPFVPGLWHGRPTTPEQSDETDEYSDNGYDSDLSFDDSDNELHQSEDRGFRVSGTVVQLGHKNDNHN